MNKKILTLLCVALLLSVAIVFVFQPDAPAPTQATTTPSTDGNNVMTIIAFGDSLTAGYGVLESEAYPAQLEGSLQKNGFDVRVINSGVSGETTFGNLQRAEFIRAQKPDVVILGIGGNDALRSLDVGETRGNIQKTIDVLTEGPGSARVLLLQMQAPLNAGRAYKTNFDSLYVDLARVNNIPLVPFITEELFLDTNNKLGDGIHYNKTGYEKVVAQHVLPAVTTVLGDMQN